MRARRLLSAISAAALLIAWPSYGHAGDPARPTTIDVSLVTPDDFAAIVIHPRRIAQSPLVAKVLKDEMIARAIKKFGIDPSEVEEVILFLRLGKNPWGGPPGPTPVMVTRFTHEVDAKELLAKLQKMMAPHGPVPIKEIEIGGKTCLNPSLGPTDAPLAYAPTKNTIVFAPMLNMDKIVSGARPKGPLLERLKKADADQDIIIALAPAAFPNLDKIIDAAKANAPPLMMTYLDAAKTVRGGTTTFNLTGPRLLRVMLDVKDAEAAGNVEDLLEQALRMASGGLMLAKQGIPKDAQATLGPLVKVAEQLVDGAKAAKSGSQVTLDFKRPQMLDTAGPAIVNAVAQSVMEARAAARRAQQMNNMRQISIAMLIHLEAKGSFPPAAIMKDGKRLLSWRVAILPNVEEAALYERFHLDEPWDSPHNLEVAKKMPAVFQTPDSPNDGKTRVMLFTGKGAAFDGDKKVRAAEITDGMSHTILCVEAGADKAVPWTKPEDLPFDPESPLAALGKVSPKGFLAAFFDGHVEQLKVDNKTLKALITPDGGEVIDLSNLHGAR